MKIHFWYKALNFQSKIMKIFPFKETQFPIEIQNN